MATDIPSFPQNKLDYKITLYNGSALLPHITTPTAGFQNGMVWTTTAGLFARINNATIGPFLATAPGVTGWTASLNTASPNNITAASRFLSTAGSADVDAVLQPKASGALLGSLPDSTATGGDKRGSYATDWQREREFSDQVASGNGATIAGGARNKVTGTYASILGGDSNIASAYGAAVIGGIKNNANGTCSSSISGAGADAEFVEGVAFQGTSSGSVTPYQRWMLVMGAETTNATPEVACTSPGFTVTAERQVTLRDASSHILRGVAVARQDATGDTKSWEFVAHIRRGAGAATTAMVAACTPTVVANTASAATWALTVDANTTLGCLRISGVGQSAKTIRWTVSITECARVIG